MKKYIEIKGAKENNLKNIDVKIPTNELVVITGLSGSGKSSLAFNVLYSEGRRRYVNSLSTYAQQFLGGTNKPNVDSIQNLSPAIAIDQKQSSNNPRSTVGTITEIYDFLRLLFAKIGIPYCPNHNEPITAQTTKNIVDQIYENSSKRIMVLAPIIQGQKGTHNNVLINLKKEGFLRVRVNKSIFSLNDEIELEKNKKHDIEIVVDSIQISEEERNRITEAINVGSTYSKGLIKIYYDNLKKEELFSKNHACKHCNFSMPNIESRLFSFNSPFGACEQCHGLGKILQVTWESLVENQELSINEGGIEYFKNLINSKNIEWQLFDFLLKTYGIDKNKMLKNFSKEEKEIVLYGSKEPLSIEIQSRSGNTFKKNDYIEGIGNLINRRFLETNSTLAREYYKKYMSEEICHSCKGERLNKYALAVRVKNKTISDITQFSIDEAIKFFTNLKFQDEKAEISKLILNEIISRLEFLNDVGLNYLTLNRVASTLSGGESQRIRLASQIGSNLTGVLYVLDEPSIGLHQKDNDRLLETLKKIRNLGNTVVVVEHDEDTILKSDYVIDIGPKAGRLGGEVVAFGTPNEVAQNPNSITGKYISKKMKIDVPLQKRSLTKKTLVVKEAQENNLKKIDVIFPLGLFIAVTGVSGSGKSTLVNEILYKGIKSFLNPKLKVKPGKHKEINGLENLDKIVNISQSAIGKTPRSNPATYTGVFDDIRDVFAKVPLAQERGFTKSRFSFNVKGGRCEKCQGDGELKIIMNFMPDVYVKCQECDGQRYNEETLEIKYKNKNIYDVLEMTIEQAHDFFKNIPNIKQKLEYLIKVGLGYIKVGHPATLLSGGEAQRVKLATYLQKKPTGKTIYILDEPTTGLHIHDVSKLAKVLQSIVDHGDTVVVIEHNIDMIKQADWIIDLGPDGGKFGGEVIAQGPPSKVEQSKTSYTAKYLKNSI